MPADPLEQARRRVEERMQESGVLPSKAWDRRCAALVDDLLAAHLAELAGEHDVTDAAAKEMMEVMRAVALSEQEMTNEQYARLCVKQVAPILRAPLLAENQQLKAALEAVGIGFIEGEGWYYTCEPHGEVPAESLTAALQAAMNLQDEVAPPQPPNKYEETLAAYRQVNHEVGAENQQLRDRVRELEHKLRECAALLEEREAAVRALEEAHQHLDDNLPTHALGVIRAYLARVSP